MAHDRDAGLPHAPPAHGAFAQGRTDPNLVTLHKDWSYLNTDPHGEMTGQPLEGFFTAGTRFVSAYRVWADRREPVRTFNASLSHNQWYGLFMVPGSMEEGDLPEGTVPR